MPLVFPLLAIAGAILVVGSMAAMRSGGAQPALARRLAGPREVRVGHLLDAEELPDRPVRVVGRVRCGDPLVTVDDERLVAFHRDVEVMTGGSWRSVERLRETRSFELWDHDGSLTIDPSRAAEPLVAIPKVWRGEPAVLEEPHASAVAMLAERHGPATAARSVIRTLGITDRLTVVARPVRGDDGRVALQPPPGGFVISNLALDDAIRLLGGAHRRLTAFGIIGVAIGAVLLGIGVVGAVVSAVV